MALNSSFSCVGPIFRDWEEVGEKWKKGERFDLEFTQKRSKMINIEKEDQRSTKNWMPIAIALVKIRSKLIGLGAP